MPRVYVFPNRTVSIRPWEEDAPNWELCLQYCRFPSDANTDAGELTGGDLGYRFIYRVDGKLKAKRGGARIPSKEHADQLWAMAKEAGWGHLDGENGDMPVPSFVFPDKK